MRDEQHGAGGVHQCVLQALDRGKVEMVGRFVQGEDIRCVPKGNGDLDALPFAVAEGVPAVSPVVRNAKAPSPVHGGGVPAVHEVVPVRRWRIGALDGILRRADLPNRAIRGPECARGDLEQGRLPSSIRPDDARPFAFGEEGGDMGEKGVRHAGIGKRDVVELEEPGHGPSVAQFGGYGILSGMNKDAGRDIPYDNWFAGRMRWKIPIGWVRRLPDGGEQDLAREPNYETHR